MGTLLAAGIGIILLLSWTAWGEVLQRTLRSATSLRHPEKAALGLCVLIALGGWLNLFGWISPLLLKVSTLVPLLIGCVLWRREGLGFIPRKRMSPAILIGSALLLAWIAVVYFGTAASHYFMVHDDLHSYLVFPIRALQTGSMEGDPFNVRRLESALGGKSFIDAIYLSWAPLATLNIVDLGLGLLLLLGLSFQWAKDQGLSFLKTGLVLILVVLAPSPWVNLTSLVLGEALFLLLFMTAWRLAQRRFERRSDIWVFALACSGLVVLKSSFLVGVFFTAFSLGLWSLFEIGPRRTALWTLECTALAVAIALPWMLSLHKTAGTYFYPILGRGYHATAYGFWPSLSAATPAHEILYKIKGVLKDPPNLMIVLLTGFLGSTWPGVMRKKEQHETEGGSPLLLVLLAIGALLASVTVGFATGWTSTHRYNFAFLFPLVVFLLVLCLARPTGKAHGVVAAIVFAGWIGLYPYSISGLQQTWAQSLRYPLPNEWIRLRPSPPAGAWMVNLEEEEKKARALQSSVPAGAPLLARLSYPFLLDFSRNPVFVPDFPGAASPPPGMPLFQGPERLSNYLLSHSIRYVAYSYRDQANFTEPLLKTLEKRRSLWMELQARGTFDFQNSLMSLRQSRKVLYDDGSAFVLDLGQPGR
jgi:hypothetical protein